MYSEIIVFSLCVFATGGRAVKYQDEVNTINQEERRAATPEVRAKTELRPSETKTFHRFYFPSAHESSGTGSSSGHIAYGHNTGYSHVGPQYYIPQAPTFHSGHSYGEIGGGHGGGNYDGSEYGSGYGFIHGGGGGGGGGEGIGHGVSTGHKEGSYKGLALKAILIPLAGIALLGAAAALSTNPILLQLGVLNGRRRRRRSLREIQRVYPTNPYVKPARATTHF